MSTGRRVHALLGPAPGDQAPPVGRRHPPWLVAEEWAQGPQPRHPVGAEELPLSPGGPGRLRPQGVGGVGAR